MIKLKNRYLIAIKVVFLLFIIIIPWSISDYGDNVRPEKITPISDFMKETHVVFRLTNSLFQILM